MIDASATDRLLVEIEVASDELVDLARRLIRIPTVNPPGEAYAECAKVLGAQLAGWGMTVEYVEADGLAEHSAEHPRVNVMGRWVGARARPCLHLNGHLDVVPPGDGWSVDPFAALVQNGRLYGRGASDMKSGLAAAAFAVDAVRRAGIELAGTVEVSGTVDEESGGFAGVAYLCEGGWIGADRTDYAIIPEPFGPDRICVGHKGVYWCDVVAHGRVAHGSMPHLGRSAIDDMVTLLEALRSRLAPQLDARITEIPVVPSGARSSTLNVNAILGGQDVDGIQSPCVADRCVATLDRRYIHEESLDDVRAEIERIVQALEADDPDRCYAIDERLVVEPVRAPADSPVVLALSRAVERVRGAPPERVASPGTYDQKHFAKIAGVEHCVAYGPGPLSEAHRPDESCSIDDLVASAKVLALTIVELVG